jgi:hypothetical protein
MASQWDSFPPTYRAEEMRTLARWILTGRSGSVVGLPGCGRSNLLGFLCYRPEVLRAYLPPNAGPVALVPVDLNQLPSNDASAFYRVILRSFYWVRDYFDQDMQETAARLYRENWTVQDAFIVQSAFHELLFAFQARQTQVVLVLNRLDHFCQLAAPQVINTLRGLRDSFRETLCIIAGMLQEAAYLPDPEALGDVYELLDSHVCWVGAMAEADARWVIATATCKASAPPVESEIRALLALTGRFPALLKAIGPWWLDTVPKPPMPEWRAALAAQPIFQSRLTKVWNSLTHEEQFALAAVCEWQDRSVGAVEGSPVLREAARALTKDHANILLRLAAKGVCCRTEKTGWQILGELLADHIRRVGPSSRGRIRLDEPTDEIYQGLTPLRNLTPQEDKLLRFLLKYPYKLHTNEHLISEIWGGETISIGITAVNLQGLISDLREKVEATRSEPRYVINQPRRGYRFYPEGRPE